MAKEFAKRFYNSAVWKQTRQQVLKRCGYICEIEGCMEPAVEVDHIIELTPKNISDTRISLGMDNLRGLCHNHHTAKTRAEQEYQRGSMLEKYVFDAEGNPVPAASPREGASKIH